MAFVNLNALSAPQVYDDGNGTVIHTKNGVLHREDGPAVDTPIHQEWYVNGVCHRDDGPARMFKETRIAEWWSSGKYIVGDTIDAFTFLKHLHKARK